MGLDERDLETTVATPAHSSLDARDVVAAIPADFRLESGDRLEARQVVGRIHGPADAPLVVVAGGISSGRFVADWWPAIVRPGGPVDPGRLRVLAVDLPPGPDAPAVTITTHDQARLLALLIDAMGAPGIDAFIGASWGGCVGLAFAELFPARLARLVVVAAAHRAHPQATAWRGIQRRILRLGLETGRVDAAVGLARELAMTAYRTPEELDLRFGGAPAPARAGGLYAVCDYLVARGRAYREINSPARWIALSDSLDRHAVSPERVLCPVTLLAFASDRLVPLDDMRELAARLPNRERLVEAPSIFGHDAFLKESAVVARVLETALSPLFAPAPEIAA